MLNESWCFAITLGEGYKHILCNAFCFIIHKQDELFCFVLSFTILMIRFCNFKLITGIFYNDSYVNLWFCCMFFFKILNHFYVFCFTQRIKDIHFIMFCLKKKTPKKQKNKMPKIKVKRYYFQREINQIKRERERERKDCFWCIAVKIINICILSFHLFSYCPKLCIMFTLKFSLKCLIIL